MTYRNKEYEIGDLVESVWTDRINLPVLVGIVAGFPEAWKGKKIDVLWNEVGMRTEWINDIKRVKVE